MELVRNRPSDARALITTFFECLKFVLGKHSRESDLPSTFSVSLLLEQVCIKVIQYNLYSFTVACTFLVI